MMVSLLQIVGCKQAAIHPTFMVSSVDRQITGTSVFPVAVDPNLVGTYPVEPASGGGYFYDDVLEYRVWLNPNNGAEPLNGRNDYFVAFAQYEAAAAFSRKASGASPPFALVRQLEWIEEPNHGEFVPQKTERITEWQLDWLKTQKRTAKSIDQFMKHPFEAGP
ncbi:hypothetical protein [Granulicella tundricola]|uniref:Uncharacterized protein n=1 Tax=Granulicella tundricola (strain ATCC BAA-1859 / DSM 23138 / MP5ACTX9) TaxID=1198114 RepID=E8X810_GRATM|nr:hypothetical protein [Granulicella tundricola]ADW71594.1 hypothetical protein AciX9_4664 [Granulicella tundricola MP5ACTX9]